MKTGARGRYEKDLTSFDAGNREYAYSREGCTSILADRCSKVQDHEQRRCWVYVVDNTQIDILGSPLICALSISSFTLQPHPCKAQSHSAVNLGIQFRKQPQSIMRSDSTRLEIPSETCSPDAADAAYSRMGAGFASRTPRAQLAIRANSPSARLVRTIGTFAPTTTPAASAPARY
jgi:hypothetical protein